MALPVRQPYRQQSRQMSTDPHNELNPHMDHYIGIDVGTGSARACIINSKGDIVGLASENIGLWQPEQGYYVRPIPAGTLHGTWLMARAGTIDKRYLAVHLLVRPACSESTQHQFRHHSRHCF